MVSTVMVLVFSSMRFEELGTEGVLAVELYSGTLL